MMDLSRIWPLLLGTGMTLGLGAPIAKAAARHGVDALAFALWPTLLAGLSLGVVGLLRHGRPDDVPGLIRFGAIAGLLGHALPMSALFWLSAHAGAGFASLSLALPPVFTLLVSVVLGFEPLAVRRAAAVGLGLTGALLLLAGRGGSFEASMATVGLALAIPMSIGIANVYRARRMPPGLSGEWMSAATLLSSSSMLAATSLARGDGLPPLSAPAVGWLAAQTVVLSIGYLLYFALQRRAEPVAFSFIGHVMMLTGVALGTLAFGERLPWTVWPAAGLVFAALILMLPQTPARPAASVRPNALPSPLSHHPSKEVHP